jgi:hypothetical protein
MFLGLCQELSKCFDVSFLPVTIHEYHKNVVLVSQGCHNNSPQTLWIKTTEIYYLTVLKTKSTIEVSLGLKAHVENLLIPFIISAGCKAAP